MYGLTIDFSDITNMSLIEKSMGEMDVGRKVNGANGFGILQGNFQSEALGETLLFVRVNSSPTLRIERDHGKDVYLSFSSGEKTMLLFDELTVAMDRRVPIGK